MNLLVKLCWAPIFENQLNFVMAIIMLFLKAMVFCFCFSSSYRHSCWTINGSSIVTNVVNRTKVNVYLKNLVHTQSNIKIKTTFPPKEYFTCIFYSSLFLTFTNGTNGNCTITFNIHTFKLAANCQQIGREKNKTQQNQFQNNIQTKYENNTNIIE